MDSVIARFPSRFALVPAEELSFLSMNFENSIEKHAMLAFSQNERELELVYKEL